MLSLGASGIWYGLAEAAAYGEQYKKWSYDSLPILPQEWQYTVASRQGKAIQNLKRPHAPRRRFRGCQRLRRRARGRADFPLCLSSSGLQEALCAVFGFPQWKNEAIRRRALTIPEGRAGIRRPLLIPHYAGQRLTGLSVSMRPACFSCLYGKTLERGTCADPDA